MNHWKINDTELFINKIVRLSVIVDNSIDPYSSPIQ